MAGFHAVTGDAYSPKREENPRWLAQLPICPECGSSRAWRDGFRNNGIDMIQRWLCRDCGFRFSNPGLSHKKENQHTNTYRVCVSDSEAKNLVEVETTTRQETGQREATNDDKSSLFNFAWWQKKEGYAESTITSRVKLLKILTKRNANLLDPE